MAAPRFRTGSAKKKKVRLPSGDLAIHYSKKRVSNAHCCSCNALLGGVPAKRVYELRKLPKTARRPQRPYGGVLCHACLAQKIRDRAREL